MTELFVDRNKRIAIYDDLFSFREREEFFGFVENSYFKIGWADGTIPERLANRFLHSVFSVDDLNRMGILNKIINSDANKELVGYFCQQAVVNLSTAADTNYIHTHPNQKILLYYANLEWQEGWHGETLFFDEASKNIVFGNPYTPGRLIAFDGSIPHTIRPQSHIATQYRFTLALILNKC